MYTLFFSSYAAIAVVFYILHFLRMQTFTGWLSHWKRVVWGNYHLYLYEQCDTVENYTERAGKRGFFC